MVGFTLNANRFPGIEHFVDVEAVRKGIEPTVERLFSKHCQAKKGPLDWRFFSVAGEEITPESDQYEPILHTVYHHGVAPSFAAAGKSKEQLTEQIIKYIILFFERTVDWIHIENAEYYHTDITIDLYSPLPDSVDPCVIGNIFMCSKRE